MTFVWAVYVTIPIVTLVVCSLLAYLVYALHSDVRGSRWFVASLLLTDLWMGLHILMLVAAEPELQILAFELEVKAATASFLAFALFASLYSRSDFHRHVLGKLAFGVTGLVLLTPTFIDPFNDLVYRSTGVVDEPFSYATTEPRAAFLILLTVALGLTGAGLFALVRYLLSTPRKSGAQLLLLILGSLSIAAATVVGATGVFPARELNHAAYGALGYALFNSFALFRFRLFEMQPVARNAVVEQLQDPVFVLNSDRELADYNAAAAELLPDTETALGTPFDSLRPTIAEAVVDAESGGSAVRVSLPEDGEPRHFSVNVSVVGDEADPDWYSIVLRDVTDLERSRWQLSTQNDRLDQVASTVSHDLRNPINVAQGFLDVIENRLDDADLDPALESEIEEYVAKVDGSHDRMLDIIEDILTIAREGKTVEETESVSLATVAESAWDNVDTREATLTVDDDVTFQADRSKLLTVFENLIRNAVEHVGDDVTVEVGPTDFGFYIQDDGPGIPPDKHEQVFEYGYSTGSGGTGLGLSIVQTMAESHGWTVELDERYGDGARFVFGLGGELPEPRADSATMAEA